MARNRLARVLFAVGALGAFNLAISFVLATLLGGYPDPSRTDGHFLQTGGEFTEVGSYAYYAMRGHHLLSWGFFPLAGALMIAGRLLENPETLDDRSRSDPGYLGLRDGEVPRVADLGSLGWPRGVRCAAAEDGVEVLASQRNPWIVLLGFAASLPMLVGLVKEVIEARHDPIMDIGFVVFLFGAVFALIATVPTLLVLRFLFAKTTVRLTRTGVECWDGIRYVSRHTRFERSDIRSIEETTLHRSRMAVTIHRHSGRPVIIGSSLRDEQRHAIVLALRAACREGDSPQ